MDEHVVLNINYDAKQRLYYVDEDEGEIDFGFENLRELRDVIGMYVSMNLQSTYEVVFSKGIRVAKKFREGLAKLVEEHNRSIVG
jgi:hypothetical protein